MMLAAPQKHLNTTNTYHDAVNSRIKCLDTHGHENRSSASLSASCSCQHVSTVFVMVLLVAAHMFVAVSCVVDGKNKLFGLSWTQLMVHIIAEENHHSITHLSSS